MSDIAELWREYKATGDPVIQEELVVNYQGLVYKLAHKIARKLRQGTEVEELISDGMLGLVKAIEAFEPERGFKFSTYATPVIRGSIYNGLRRLDWMPERTRAKARNLQRAMEKLSQLNGRKPTEADLAEELEISAKEVYDLIANLSSMYLLSLDQPIGDEEGDASMGDLVEDTGFVSPEAELEYSEERDALREGLESLPDRERRLLQAHYFEGITFEALAREEGISKQRVSQIHLRAIRRLRENLGSMEVSREAMQDFLVDRKA